MTLRARIAIAVAASFLIAGALVLTVSALTYQSAVFQTSSEAYTDFLRRLGTNPVEARNYLREHPEVARNYDPSKPGPNGRPSVNEVIQQMQRDVQHDAVARSRVWSGVALGAMAVVAGLLGWLLAGRALRPLRSITARARTATATDLSTRVSLSGPHDEVRELGDTFDDMLARLEGVFDAQRRFSAQVSHEIRTPLAIISSEAELLLRDARPEEASPLHQIHEATVRAERIISALLVLSRSGRGDLRPEDLELDRVAGDAIGEIVHEPGWRQIRVDLALDPAPIRADRALMERLVANLLSNAVRHNRPGGFVEVRTRLDGEAAVLEIENSVGEDVSAASGPQSDPRDRPAGGIGLTVVDAVLAAHGGSLEWTRSQPDSVTVEVRLPARRSVAGTVAVV